MDKEALLDKISQLRQAAEQMEEPDRTFKLDDVAQLSIMVESTSVEDIAQKMQSIELPAIDEMDANIQLAVNATSSHSQRVGAFNKAYDLIKGAISLAI